MVVNTTTTYKSEKQRLLALTTRTGRGRRRVQSDAPPPYSPVAGRDETTLSDISDVSSVSGDSDTVSTWTGSTCSSPGSPTSAVSSILSPIDTYTSTTSSYTSYAEGFATFVTLTTRVVPIAALPPAYSRCPSCADGYSAAMLGLTCPHNCMPAHTSHTI